MQYDTIRYDAVDTIDSFQASEKQMIRTVTLNGSSIGGDSGQNRS